ncbi:MAG: hypothetical protein HRU14_01365 [Planctomycetes bacterium]|nr:hypothetical protein [Planctomycetota bacterium]
MSSNKSVDREGLADYLAREFATGGPPASGDDANEFDANDVAAFARGNLFPGRRAAILNAMLTDAGLREAVAFEKAVLRKERSRRVLRWAGAAAAAVLIALAIAPLVMSGDDPVSDARRLLAEGEARAAITLLENARNGHTTPEADQLLALARFANGDADPLNGLKLGKRGDWAPLRDGEIEEPAQVRGDREPAIGIRESVLDTRPAIKCRRGVRALTLVLYRSDALGTTLFRCEVPGGDAGGLVEIKLPDTVPDLEPGTRYGVELREGRRLVAHSDFKIAESYAAHSCQAVVLKVSEALADATQRHHALGNLYHRRGFYVKAAREWRKIPEAERTIAVRRALKITERRLWNK